MTNPIKIQRKTIGGNEKPFLIAEMSGNHNQSLEKALAIVEAAHESGADALKVQTYTADTMTIDIRKDEFMITDKKKEWDGKSLYQLYQEAYTPWEWHKPIKEKCEELGMIFFSSPFDATAVDFLEELGVSLYKVASPECNDLKLIERIAKTKKPMIISTGMACLAEIDEAVRTARKNGCQDIILLKCTTAYPADARNANLRTIPHMAKAFQVLSGLSDHTMGSGGAIAATALGATVIEKHFTIKRSEGGVDAAFSMEPQEFKSMAVEIERAWLSLGQVTYERTLEDEKSSNYRRSLYVVEDIKEGEMFTEKNIRAIRPGLGLPTKYMDIILGKKAKKSVSRGTPVGWSLI